MPKVPTYDDSVVPLRPVPDARQDSVVSPSFLAANPARVEQGLQGIIRAGGDLAEVAAKAQEERNGYAIFGASAALNSFMVEKGALMREYRGARAWGVAGKIMEQFDDYARKASGGLDNEPQRKAFDQRLAKARTELEEQALGWEQQQRTVSTQNTAQADIRNAQDRALAAVGTASEALALETAAKNIRQNLDWLQEAYGWSREEATYNTQLEYSRLHLGVVQRKLIAGDAAGARAYFENNKVEIRGEVYDDVEQKLKAGETQVQARDAVEAALALTDNDVDLARDEVRNAKLAPEVEKAAILRLKEIDSENDERKREKQKTANDAAWAAFFDAGSRLSGVPGPLLHNADAATRLAMQHESDRVIAQRKGKADAAPQTDPDTYYALRQMIRDDPAGFKAMDLRKVFPKLSPGDREEFIKLQTAPDERLRDIVTIDKQLSIAHGLMGLGSRDVDEKATFDQAVIEQLDIAMRERGKPLTMEERQKVIDRMMLPGSIPGFLFDKSRRYFQVKDTPDEGRFRFEYRDSDLERARQALAKRGVAAPTREQLEEVVRRAYGLQ
jgi:hypothetical protein